MSNNHQPLILVLYKKFHDYGNHCQMSNGVRTSVMFVVDMLLKQGYRAKIAEAIDGNSIDKIVTQEKPARVILEAIWVTPTKMAELKKLHPSIRWTVRVHSEIPFLANEGMAISWLTQFMGMGIEVAFNSEQTVEDFSVLGKTAYLPNYYPLCKPRRLKPSGNTLDVGCFGAIRPMKNQLEQAFGAIRYADSLGKVMTFHINADRIEQSGDSNMKNIVALFKATKHTLQMHCWLSHDDFLELLATMDISLSVSFSETFCICLADAVSLGVPAVGSSAIRWLPRRSRAKVDSAQSIADAMARADSTTVAMNHEALENYLEDTIAAWNIWAESL